MSNQFKWALVAFAISLILPFVVYPVLVMKILCFGLFAAAFNLMLGYVGMLSFGHAAFLACGGYTTGYLLTQYGVSTEVGILLGTLFSAVLGAAFGVLSVKREGIYFAMVTLALSQLVFFVFVQSSFTGGENGLQGIPRGTLFGFIDLSDNLNMYYFVLAVFIFGMLLIYRTVHSPFGQVLKAIRENEARTISLGYDVKRYKLQAFVLSAALAGLAGSTKAVVFQLESLTDAHWHMSGEIVLMTLVGGVGTITGPVLGASIIVGIQNVLSGGPFGTYIHIITGVIFVACVLMFRSGIVGELVKFRKNNF